MQKVFYLGANGLAAFQDLATGALFAVLLGRLEGVPLEWWYVAGGAFLMVLPDFDLIYPLLRRVLTGRHIDSDHHESVFHWPLFMLPVVTVTAWTLGGSYWGLLAFFCLFFHYIHDGSNRQPEDRILWFFRIRPRYWSARDQTDPAKKLNHDQWIQYKWLQPSDLSIREVTIGSIACGLATVLLTTQILPALLIMFIAWAGVITFWKTYKEYYS